MNYTQIRQRASQFESVTGLKVEEFDYLYRVFARRWKKFYRHHTIAGSRRQYPNNNPGKDTRTLASIADKLFFVLVYLKNYSLQEMMAASFGFSQSNASKWIKVLRPILQESLRELDLLPEQCPEKVADKLVQLGEQQCILDATERPINQALDRSVEEQFYSGKKKAHTVKNNVICTNTQLVVYLSQTHEGRMHDKKIAELEQCRFPNGIQLIQDRAFIGYAPENIQLVEPFKKPRTTDLSELKKWFNTYVARLRITVENAINGIKRCRIVKDKCRHFCQQFRHQVILICAGLHNLRVNSPYRDYKSKNKWPPARADNFCFE